MMNAAAQADGATSVAQIVQILEQIAPPQLSEAWDNTGLLLGDPDSPAERVMTCLTLTPASVDEAIAARAQLVISHHPLPFKPLAKITTQTLTGRLLWDLARHGVSVYSPHTAWDSATDGINAQLARKLSLHDVEPLVANPQHDLGSGRCGRLSKPQTLDALAEKLFKSVPYCRLRAVAARNPIQRVAIGCGSGGSFLSAAAARDCQLLVTGEATFHTCLEAEALGIGLLMIGHFASEKFAMDQLAARLASALPEATVWGSRQETDPVTSLSFS
ncbi:MAG: Nif3-like dinuclear metal center hexameric protein [Aureliella sp.]|jgi:dinuclear metal center YbgI/SA1388 family protein